MTIPFNINYTIGNDLREVPEDIDEFKKAIAFMEEKLVLAETNKEKAWLLSKLGVLNRIIGRVEISKIQLIDAQHIIQDLNEERMQIINDIRIGQTLQYTGKFEQAEQMYISLEEDMKTGKHTDLLDFIYQHKGKNYYEWGRLQEAVSAFEKALMMREKKGNKALIQSTRIVLEKVNK